MHSFYFHKYKNIGQVANGNGGKTYIADFKVNEQKISIDLLQNYDIIIKSYKTNMEGDK